MYASSGPDQKMAQEVLSNLKEHPEAWTKVNVSFLKNNPNLKHQNFCVHQVDAILEYSTNQQTKYYALQILESVIKTRWKVLPRTQCEGIKKYIVGLIIKTSSNPEQMEEGAPGAKGYRLPKKPSAEQVAAHEFTHFKFEPWCEHCADTCNGCWPFRSGW